MTDPVFSFCFFYRASTTILMPTDRFSQQFQHYTVRDQPISATPPSVHCTAANPVTSSSCSSSPLTSPNISNVPHFLKLQFAKQNRALAIPLSSTHARSSFQFCIFHISSSPLSAEDVNLWPLLRTPPCFRDIVKLWTVVSMRFVRAWNATVPTVLPVEAQSCVVF